MLYGVSVATLIGFAKVDGVAAGLVTPYLGWLTYIAAVNGEIILKNRPKKDEVRSPDRDAVCALGEGGCPASD